MSAYAGLTVGALEAGVRPRICVFLPGTSFPESFDLAVVHDEQRWLVRLGLFAALAQKARDPNQRQPVAETADDWELLDALQRLDWQAVRRARAGASEVAKQLVDVPEGLCASEPPADAEVWEWLRHVLQSALYRRAGRGTADALLFARPWVEARTAELLLRQDSPPGSPRASPGRSARAFFEDSLDYDQGLRHGNGNAGFAPARAFLDDARGLWAETNFLPTGLPPRGELSAQARSHLRMALHGAGGDDPATLLLMRLGYPPWPLIPREELVVVHAVGGSNVRGDGRSPMAQALIDGLPTYGWDLGRCHLRLVASRQTTADAHDVAALAQAAGFGSSAVIGDLDVGDYEQIQREVYRQLSKQTANCSETLVLTGPGGKALNLGATTASVQAASDALRRVSIGQLKEQDDGSTLLLIASHGQARVLARFAHDTTIALVLPALIDRLDLESAMWLLNAGSSIWQPVIEAVHRLNILVFGADEELRHHASELAGSWNLQTGELTSVALWPARARLFTQLASSDPWRAVGLVVGAGRSAWGAAWCDSLPMGDACTRLEEWLMESPLGAKPWACPPAARDIEQTVNTAIEHLRTAGRTPDSHPETDLIAIRDRVVGRLEHVRAAVGKPVAQSEPREASGDRHHTAKP